MAERITKVRECDRLNCRTSTGVKDVQITIREREIGAMEWEPINEECFAGDLCFAHNCQARRQARKIFNNTKEYKDESAE